MVKLLMKQVIFLVIAIICAGCKSTGLQVLKPDGTKIVARDSRLFMNTSGIITFSVDTNGVVSLRVEAGSMPHAESLKAITEGAVAGAIDGFKGGL